MGCLFFYCHGLLHYLEDNHIIKKTYLSLAHVPTLMLMIGYPMYWVELYFFKNPYGRTSLLTSCIFAILAGYAVWKNLAGVKKGWVDVKKQWGSIDLFTRRLFILGGFLAIGILACSLYASLFPPHLVQESDVLTYHMTLPRQHLLRSSFQHIPWSTVDLYLIPIDLALTPFWFCTQLPNKFPQFLFLLGLIGVVKRLAGHFTCNDLKSKIFVLFGVMGMHIVGIQMGTAMLDITMCYLFLAAMDSFLNKRIFFVRG